MVHFTRENTGWLTSLVPEIIRVWTFNPKDFYCGLFSTGTRGDLPWYVSKRVVGVTFFDVPEHRTQV